MGSPYLKSGEVIVLTTNRVSVDAVPYEVMLTTERLFFIDERHARFEPRIILLSAILSVHGGRTPADDPVITLIFRTGPGGDEQLPMNLVFSHHKNENRKPERDDWVRTLIRLSITQHDKVTEAKAPAVPEIPGEHGLRPAIRRGIAPEKVRPLSSMGARQPEPLPLAVIPEEIGGDIPGQEAAVGALGSLEKPAAETITDEPSADFAPVRRQPPVVLAAPARIIIPQIIEELLPERKPAAPQDVQEPAPAADLDHEALFRTIPAAARSLTITEERTAQSPGSPEPMAPVAGITVAEIPPVPEAGVPAAAKHEEVPEIVKKLHTGATEPAEEEPVTQEPAPEPFLEIPKAAVSGVPESRAALDIPENVVQEIIHRSASDAIFQRESAAAETPPVRHPIPPAREIRPLRTTLLYAAIVLIVIALIAGGAMLLLRQEPADTGIPMAPVTATVQVTTLPPVTAKATAASPVTMPATTIPVPSPAAFAIPQSGVYVRVNSTAYYFGNLGNPGLLQQVSGTGDHFYPVLRTDRPVQVSVQKKDNSGALLAVEVYRDGALIGARSVTAPRGSVDLLINPVTALPPGLKGNNTT